MKKVLIINTSYREFGGEDSNIQEEVRALKKRFIVNYLEFKNSDKLNLFDYISFFIRSNFNSNKLLKKKLSEFQPDLVYLHNTWFKANLGIFSILKKNNYLVVHKIHSYRYYCTSYFSIKKHLNGRNRCFMCGIQKKSYQYFNKYFRDSYFKSLAVVFYGKKYLKILLTNNLKVLVMNHFHKNFLQELGIENKNIGIYYNQLENLSQNKFYNPNSDTVVYAGRLTENKGLQELLESWTKANTQNLKLLIIGSGEIERKIKNDFKNQNIEFLGSLSNLKTIEIIKKSRAVITATKIYEGQPRLLTEASVYGVPAIFPSFGGIDEYFPKNYSLSFEQFNYKDLIKKIESIHDSSLMEKLSNEVFLKTSSILNEKKLLDQFESFLIKYA